MAFLEDVRAQGGMLRSLVAAYRGDLRPRLEQAAGLLASEPDRHVVIVGMGSSLSAGRVLRPLLAANGRVALVEDAGELLHYGLGAVRAAGVVIAISQSGRSIETVRVVERLRERDPVPVISLVNDGASPVAASADLVLPLLAGRESAVATKTYVAATAVLLALAQAAGLVRLPLEELEALADRMDGQAAEVMAIERIVEPFAGTRALIVVARGPALSVAHYAALTIKESAALPTEAISGGEFRHGPLELTAAGIGLVVLAPAGPTVELGVGLAHEVAATGRPTWLLTDQGHTPREPARSTLSVSPLPDGPEVLAPLACIVPLQLAAAALARARGREAGVTLVATKVTERE